MKKLILFLALAVAASAVEITIGKDATLTATADGTQPFTYQWSKNGAAISGATASTLALTNVTQANAGSYSVVITNDAGSATATAAITVKILPPSNPRISVIEKVIAWIRSLFNRNV